MRPFKSLVGDLARETSGNGAGGEDAKEEEGGEKCGIAFI
jgi:hypothetical protein